jgi:vitamin B12 transporter
LIDYSFFDLHIGTRLNTHSEYGTKWVYNVNPSVLLNRTGLWRFKILASLSTSYITPSLYQLYSSEYGNPNLLPEDALNVETGFSVYSGEKFAFNFSWFKRDESNPIDFVNVFDGNGDWVGGEYQNVTANRNVHGVELSASYQIVKVLSVSANYTFTDTDKPESFYRIPNNKMGISINAQPLPALAVSIKYSFTGERTTFDFDSYSELKLDSYQLVDVFASYGFLKNKLTMYGGVNNVFDEQFIAVYGFTTRGRNFTAGLRFSF